MCTRTCLGLEAEGDLMLWILEDSLRPPVVHPTPLPGIVQGEGGPHSRAGGNRHCLPPFHHKSNPAVLSGGIAELFGSGRQPPLNLSRATGGPHPRRATAWPGGPAADGAGGGPPGGPSGASPTAGPTPGPASPSEASSPIRNAPSTATSTGGRGGGGLGGPGREGRGGVPVPEGPVAWGGGQGWALGFG